jgi:hypothetical protein
MKRTGDGGGAVGNEIGNGGGSGIHDGDLGAGAGPQDDAGNDQLAASGLNSSGCAAVVAGDMVVSGSDCMSPYMCRWQAP